MGLIKRSQKGSKLTVQELDGNLTYLESIGVSGLTQPTNNVIEINRPNGEKVSGVVNSYNLDIEEVINDDVVYYKNTQYDDFNQETYEITLRDENSEPIQIPYGESCLLDYNLTMTTINFGTGFNSTVLTIKQQSDGKILVGGSFTSYNGTTRNYIVRLNSDGSIDNTFNIGTSFNSDISIIEQQSDGKILVGGSFTSYNGTTSNRIIRLNSDGSIDNTFNIGTGFDSTIITIKVQSDEKILVGGVFTSYNGTSINRIIRLNSDGSIDNTFNIGTGFNSQVMVIQLQSDGKILVGGEFNSYNGTSRNRIIRLNSNGSIDNAFNIGTGFNNQPRVIKQQSDGKILVGGEFTSYNGTTRNRIVRLNTDGSRDDTFTIGTGLNDLVLSIEIQSDGKILVGGGFTSYNGTTSNRIIRLNFNGSIDNTFTIGTGFNNIGFSIQIQSDGKILVGGGFTSYNGTTSNRIIRLNFNGSIASFNVIGDGYNVNSFKFFKKTNPYYNLEIFNIGSGFDSGFANVQTITTQSDGKILVGGEFTSYNGTTRNNIIRLNSNGSRDDTFSVGTGFNSIVLSSQIQSDGKILIGGAFTSYNGTTRRAIIRLNSDGGIDNTFNTVFDSGSINSIQIQSDGKILLGGDFTSYFSINTNRIIRLNSNGSRDGTFSIGAGFNGIVRTIQIQSDGKILIGGNFTTYNGTTSNRIIRLNSDGSIDDTFNIGTGFGGTFPPIYTIQIQSDGKILVGGFFTSYNGTTRNRIIRLNSDGSIDNTFNIGTGFNDGVFTIKQQSDGKILVGGAFTSYNGTTRNRIIRLNSDGSIDNTFSIGNGFSGNGSVLIIQIQSDGRILVGGQFTFYNVIGSNRIIRLLGNGLTEPSVGSTIDKFLINTSQPIFNNFSDTFLLKNDEIIKIISFLPIYKSIVTYKLIKTK
jgi:uncharacterized delta-60 repeat protein